MSDTTAVVVAEEPKPLVVIRNALEERTQALIEVLPASMPVERFKRVSLLAISKNPDILACTPSSIVASLIEAAEIGLVPTGSLNRAWLVGFKPNAQSRPEAQLMIGYQGYADLMRDSGRVTRITAEVVYEGDHFKVVKGSDPHLEHEPAYASEDPTKITHAYAIAWFGDGGQQFEVMTKAQVDQIRAKARSKNSPAWTQSYGQMARKTALRRLANYVPLTPRAMSAFQRDDEREFGPSPAPAVTRNNDVRRLLAAKGVDVGQTAQDGPGADETDETGQVAPPAASASRRTRSTAPADGDGEAPAVCEAASDPALGDVETCVLASGHLEVDGAPQRHEAASGSKWPAGGTR